jgi:hypothetical protein
LLKDTPQIATTQKKNKADLLQKKHVPRATCILFFLVLYYAFEIFCRQ